jgi:hypothetical protein
VLPYVEPVGVTESDIQSECWHDLITLQALVKSRDSHDRRYYHMIIRQRTEREHIQVATYAAEVVKAA